MGGSSKKQTVGYFYDKDLHGVLCHSPVDAITRIECDDREILRREVVETGNTYINNPNIFGGKDKEGGIQGNIDVLFGREDQQQNSYMVGKLGEYLPSYRGVLSVVFKKLYVGMNPYLRSFKFRVRKTSVGWYDEKSIISPTYKEIDNLPSANLYLAVDTSGSMGGKKLENLKSSLQILFNDLSKIKNTVNIRLVSFSDVVKGVINGNNRNVSQFIFFANNMEAGGNTDAVSAYSNAKTFFNENVMPAANICVCVSDGNMTSVNVALRDYVSDFMDNENPPFSIAERNDVKMRGVGIDMQGSLSSFDNSGNKIPVINNENPEELSNLILDIVRKALFAVECDINPAHIIYDLLSNKIYGKGAPDSKIDLDSLKKMADTLYDERMGMSIVWGESSSFEEFMNLICDHIKAVVPYVDVQTGKWTTKLLRDDYSKPALTHLNESNIQSVKNFTRKTMSDAVNVVTVTYWDREQGKTSTISVDNPARVAQQGKTITQKIDYDGFTNSEIAGRVALRELKTLSSFLASVTLQAFGDDAMNLKVGDCFRWSWGDFRISEAVMRVTKVNYGGVLTNYATIDAIEDSFSTPNEAVVPYLPPNEQDSEEPKQADFLAMEAPYFDMIQMFGETEVGSTLEANPDIGYVLVSADRPQTNALNATLLTSLSNDFDDVGAVDFAPTARLVDDIGKTQQSFLIKNIENLSDARTNTLIQINDETMAYVSYDLGTSTLTVKRGVHDTTVHNHPADSIIYFWDEYASYDKTQQIDGTIVNVKVLTNTGREILDEEIATTKQVEFNSRAIRPYPPANVKVNNSYFPVSIDGNAVITWVDRNRLQQTGGEILGFYDGSVTSEEGVTYHYEIEKLATSEKTVVNNVSSGVEINLSDFYPESKFKLWSERDGYQSFQPVELMLVSAIGYVINFIEPIYAIGEYVNLKAKLSSGAEIVSMSIRDGYLPNGWVLNGSLISGKATTQSANEFTLQVEDSFGNIVQKTFYVKVQGVVWSQLTFDNQDMTDQVSGNTWTLGANNTFVEGIDSPYALKLGGTSLPTMIKTFSQSQDFSISADVIAHRIDTTEGILFMGNISSNNDRENLYLYNGELTSYRQRGTGTGAALGTGFIFEIGKKYNVGYVKNGNTRKIFVDGILIASDVYSQSLANSNNIYIGGNRTGGSPQYSTLTIDNLIITTGEPRFE